MKQAEKAFLTLALALSSSFCFLREPLVGHAQTLPDPALSLERPVYFAGGLAPEQTIALTALVAAKDDRGIVLLDSPKNRVYLKTFLDAYHPSSLILIGKFQDAPENVERALGTKSHARIEWQEVLPRELCKMLLPRAEEAVVCSAAPRGLLLHAACLAGALHGPLLVLPGNDHAHAELARCLGELKVRKLHAVGAAATQACAKLAGVDVQSLAGENAAADAYLRLVQKNAPIKSLVLANPGDAVTSKFGGMSILAPWIALQRRAALLLTDDKGHNAKAILDAAAKNPVFAKADNVILVADHRAIPTERKPNPLPGKDETIEFEPPGPDEAGLFSFATGRLFHEDPGVVALMLARQRLLAESKGPRRALIVSNPGGGLPLLETISRDTAQEFRNAGYETKALFGAEARADDLRRLLPQEDIFLWEGHHSTLVRDFGVPTWPEPMKPSLVFLQSCLALSESEAAPFLQRGAVGVIGSSSRTFSATGGAISLGFFDALAYDQQSLGGALRQAKNFLVAYELLKGKRLGDSAQLGGASVRSAWAFTLWGDPTLTLPPPPKPAEPLAHVRASVKGSRITLSIPEATYEPIATEKYTAQIWPNGRLAGYVNKGETDGRRKLVPLVFAEVKLSGKEGQPAPRLRSKLPEDHWAFAWDQRRGTFYVVALPRARDKKQIVFEID